VRPDLLRAESLSSPDRIWIAARTCHKLPGPMRDLGTNLVSAAFSQKGKKEAGPAVAAR
jgi:hypothetical protein